MLLYILGVRLSALLVWIDFTVLCSILCLGILNLLL